MLPNATQPHVNLVACAIREDLKPLVLLGQAADASKVRQANNSE